MLDLSAPVTYKYFSLKSPERFVLDIEKINNKVDLSSVDTKDTPLLGIRGGRRADATFRLVLDLSTATSPEVFLLQANEIYGNRLVIDFYDDIELGGAAAADQERPSVVKTVPNKDAKRDIIIALDAGHGGEDPGALGPGRIREKKVVLQIAKKLKRRIDALPGYKARLVRTGDYYIALKKRRDIAKGMKADAFVSIHADAFDDKRVWGSSVYTLSADGASSAEARFLAGRENEADSIGGVPVPEDEMLAGVIWELTMGATMDASTELAKKMLEYLKPVAKLHKSTVEHAGFAVLKSPDIPSVLLETGFISNPREAKKLASSSHQDKLAKAVVKGIQAYFNEYALEGTLIYWQKNNAQVERTYKIRSGDTLSGVAARHSVSLAELKSHNGLRSDTIRVGQILKIPAGK